MKVFPAEHPLAPPVILVLGMTSSREADAIVPLLLGRGRNVFLVTLRATDKEDPEALRSVTRKELLEELRADLATALLGQPQGCALLVGSSFGAAALLATLAADPTLESQFQRFVLLCPFIDSRNSLYRAFLAMGEFRFVRSLFSFYLRVSGDLVQNPKKKRIAAHYEPHPRVKGHFSFPFIPREMAKVVYEIVLEARANLGRLTIPTLLIEAKYDYRIPPLSDGLLKNVRALQSRHLLSRSGHYALLDADLEKVVSLIDGKE